MPEVHLPHLDEEAEHETPATRPTDDQSASLRKPRVKGLARTALEVGLISMGVFLGLAGEQWREGSHRRELADASLRNFKAEIALNRKAVGDVKDYHVTLSNSLKHYLSEDPTTRRRNEITIHGLQPVFFQHTAWDLALATQSLAYVEPKLAFALSNIYTHQQELAGLTGSILEVMYQKPPTQDFDAFLSAADLYYGDAILLEPELMRMYDDILPDLDRALGEVAPKK